MKLIPFLVLGATALWSGACSWVELGGPGGELPPRPTPATLARESEHFPKCLKRHGRLTVGDSQSQDVVVSSTSESTSPSAVLKFFLDRSGCFTVVDRSKSLNALTGADKAEGSSPPPVQADFYLTSQILYQNIKSSSVAVSNTINRAWGYGTGAFGFGSELSAIATEVKVVLTLVRASTGTQVAAEVGFATMKDTQVRAGGSYTNDWTVNGKTVEAAYLDAFAKLVARIEEAATAKSGGRQPARDRRLRHHSDQSNGIPFKQHSSSSICEKPLDLIWRKLIYAWPEQVDSEYVRFAGRVTHSSSWH